MVKHILEVIHNLSPSQIALQQKNIFNSASQIYLVVKSFIQEIFINI